MKRRHWIAALSTLFIHALLALALLGIYLRFEPGKQELRQWPPVDSAELLFGGEYVRLGEPDLLDESAETTDDPQITEPTEVAETPVSAPHQPVVTTERQSEAKALAEKAERERREAEERQRREQAKAIANRVSFGSGAQGQPDGNDSQGAVNGVAASGLGNRAIVSAPTPPKGPMGKIVIKITVNKAGNVIAASYKKGEGAAAANMESRNRCIAAAKAARISPSESAPERQDGYLTYIFK